MGLAIGIRVKRQYDGYMGQGNNPKGSHDEIVAQLEERLIQRFPDGGFSVQVSLAKEVGQAYDFGVSFAHYGDQFGKMGYAYNDLYLVLTTFILEHFSVVDGIEMSVYFSA